METKIRCAIIGLGRIASILEEDKLREKPATHAGAITTHPQTTLLAGADIDAVRRAQFKKRWKTPHLYTDAATLLKKHAVDILHIATPPKSHPALLRLAARRNVPVVVLEKPVTTNTALVKSFLREQRHYVKNVIVNHERRFAKDYRMVKTFIDAPKSENYGTLLSMTGRFYSQAPKKSLDLLLHDGTHLIDAMFFFLEHDPAAYFNEVLSHFLRKNVIALPISDFYVQLQKHHPLKVSSQKTRKQHSALKSPPHPHIPLIKIPSQLAKNRNENSVRQSPTVSRDLPGETLNLLFSYHQTKQKRKIPIAVELGSGRHYFHFEIILNFTQGRVHIGNGLLRFERARPSPYYDNFHSLVLEHKKPYQKTYPFKNMMQEAVDLYLNRKSLTSSPLTSALMPIALSEKIQTFFKNH
ncbi:hypothetical protein COTS27_00562 [Spirochaetota bacterium]|nr:hypothetical protein COTS27_00562 [Spirochaetota bacterium]